MVQLVPSSRFFFRNEQGCVGISPCELCSAQDQYESGKQKRKVSIPVSGDRGISPSLCSGFKRKTPSLTGNRRFGRRKGSQPRQGAYISKRMGAENAGKLKQVGVPADPLGQTESP